MKHNKKYYAIMLVFLLILSVGFPLFSISVQAGIVVDTIQIGSDDIGEDYAILKGNLKINNYDTWFRIRKLGESDWQYLDTNGNEENEKAGNYEMKTSEHEPPIILESGTEYEYEACADRNIGVKTGGKLNFITKGEVLDIVETGDAEVTGSYSVILNGKLNYDGWDTWFRIRKKGEEEWPGNLYLDTNGNGKQNSGDPFRMDTKDDPDIILDPGVTYQYQAVADNNLARVEYAEEIKEFKINEEIIEPEVTTQESGSVNENSAILSGKLDSMGGDYCCYVWFEYGKDESYGFETTHVPTQTACSFSEEISGLEPNTEYHFRSCANNSLNVPVYGNDRVFTTSNNPIEKPTVLTVAAEVHNASSVGLSGDLSDKGGANYCEVWFKYGETTDYGFTTAVKYETEKGLFGLYAKPDDLEPDTTYHFCAFAKNSKGTSYGEDMTFITPEKIVDKPEVSTEFTKYEDENSARLYGELIDMGGDDCCYVWFEYGETIDYGFETDHVAEYSCGIFSEDISGLEPDTEYHFRACSNNNLNEPVYGDDMTFGTISNKKPKVITGAVNDISEHSARIYGEIVDLGDDTGCWYGFCIGKTKEVRSNWCTYTSEPLSYTYSFIDHETFLDSDTTYYYCAYAQNDHGEVLAEEIKSFKTKGQKTTIQTSEIPDCYINKKNATLVGFVNENGLWDIGFELRRFAEWTVIDQDGDMKHPDEFLSPFEMDTGELLEPGASYEYRAWADNGQGKIYGEIKDFTTFRDIEVTTYEATNISSNSAILNGRLNYMGGHRCCYVNFLYGETVDYGKLAYLESIEVYSIGDFFAEISDLKSNTTYHFCFLATDEDGDYVCANDMIFTTLPEDGDFDPDENQNNKILIAGLKFDTLIPKTDDPINFQGNAVYGKDENYEDNIISWNWDFGDGDTSKEQNPEHSYEEPGEYSVKLEIEDDKENTASCSIDIEVADNDKRPPFTIPIKNFLSQLRSSTDNKKLPILFELIKALQQL